MSDSASSKKSEQEIEKDGKVSATMKTWTAYPQMAHGKERVVAGNEEDPAPPVSHDGRQLLILRCPSTDGTSRTSNCTNT
jgi:hypothetical protein